MAPGSATAGSLSQQYLDALCGGDIAVFEKLLSDDFSWTLLPASLEVPSKNRRELLLLLKQLGRLFSSVKLLPQQQAVESADSVVLHVILETVITSTGELNRGEYMFMFRCDTDRGEISRVTEFCDSAGMRKVLDAGDGEGWKLLKQTYD